MRDSHIIKSALITLFVVFSAATLYSHATGSLYPAVHLGLFVSALICTGLSFYSHSQKALTATLITIIGVATAYRLYIYGYPGTYHNIDVEWYLANAHMITKTGSIDQISNNFYRSAPAYLIALSLTQQVVGSNLFVTQAVVPLLMGVVTPLLAWLFVRLLQPDDSRSRLLAATIAAVATFGLFHSWFPIAQTLTVLPFLLCIWLLASAERNFLRTQLIVPLGLLLVILVFSHKLPVLLLVTVLAILVVFSMTRFTGVPNQYTHIALLIATLLLVQMTIMSDYILDVGGGIIAIYALGESSAPIEATAATATTTSLTTVLRGVNLLGILSVGGVTWIYGVYRWYESRAAEWAVLLVTTAICTAFTLILIPSGIPTRGLIMIEPVLAALIAVGLFTAYQSPKPAAQYLVGGVIVVLLATQTFAVIGMPDGPEQPKRYPSESELEGKQFVHDYAESQPYMVSRYAARMTTPTQPETRYNSNYLDEALLTASVNPDKHPTVLHREREIYHTTEGWYRLQWTPTDQYDRAYNQPYDGGSVSYYTSPGRTDERD